MTKNKEVNVVAVRFSEDNVSALYLDGKLAYTNNDYDNNAMLAFESFIAGVSWCKKHLSNIKWLHVTHTDKNDFPSNDGSNIPQIWPDNKYSEFAE